MADFIAGYISGATGILLGSPLDIIKVRLQHSLPSSSTSPTFPTALSLIRGSAAPILGYGALNGLLFASYTRSLSLLPGSTSSNPSYFTAGIVSGIATFIVSAPSETIKCRAQILNVSSWEVVKALGVRGVFTGGMVTLVRDAVGYGFYFKSYEEMRARGVGVLLAGGIAGCVSWASIYPLDVVKTRVQTVVEGELRGGGERRALLERSRRGGAWECAKRAYLEEGMGVFFRGLGVCMARAFLVNAVQWAVYEYVMMQLQGKTADEEAAAYM
ncbi:mitochondrial carrier [Ascodesmis nigricans]|uniref:Mitochondrial carrier n=1 Tax=Ascodesmis nigricans TaxID=341454 RepID=A0A4V3SJJ4_9PEZI|nr:mitochondrial carrier [Ascodesmis nigricans]